VTQSSGKAKRIARFLRPGPAALACFLLARSASADPVTLKWPQPDGPGTPINVSYSYSNLLDGTFLLNSPSELRAATEEALRLWAAYAPLHFIEQRDSGPVVPDLPYGAEGHPQIRIGHHAISDLAHGYYPGDEGLCGDIVFASGVPWMIGGDRWNFLEVITHELGHALGLGHEHDETAMMNPSFPTNRFGGLGSAYLYSADVRQLQAIYGQGLGSVQPLHPAPEPATYLLILSGVLGFARRRVASTPQPRLNL
jgi:hypothetical protein